MKKAMFVLGAGVLASLLMSEQAFAAGEIETKGVVKKEAAAVKPIDKWEFMPAVVAEIGGRKITKIEFVKNFNEQAEMAQMPMDNIDPTVLKRVAPKMVEEFVSREILLDLAVKAGFKPSPAAVEKVMKEKLAEVPAQQLEVFKKSLAERNMTMDGYIKQMAGNKTVQSEVAIDNWLKEKVNAKVQVSKAEAKEFYDKNMDKFKVPGDAPEMVRASHILIKIKDNSPKADADAKAKAEELLKKVKGGASFEAVAEKESACPSGKMAKGSLGAFSKGDMVKEFEDVAFSLKPGEISGVVKTKFGYHIIRRDAPEKPSVRPLSEVEPMLLKFLKAQKEQKQVDDLVAAEKAKHKVSVFVK